MRSPFSTFWKLGCTCLLVACSRDNPTALAAPPLDPGSRTPVLVELFSSEGCSSCPAGEEALADIVRSPPPGVFVVPLEFHVDYWNDLGHVDPFAKPSFSDRQRSYTKVLGTSSVYTPQAVVDGKTELVGSRAAELTHAIAKAAREMHAPTAFHKDEKTGNLEVNLGSLGQSADIRHVFLATIVRNPKTVVKHGENAGRTLVHTWVVRSLAALGDVAATGGTLEVPPASLHGTETAGGLVAFANRQSDGKVVGTAVYFPAH